MRCFLCNQRGHRKQDCVASKNRRERFNSNSKNQKKVEPPTYEANSRRQNTEEKLTSMTPTTSIAPTVKKNDESSIYDNVRATKSLGKNNNSAKDLSAILPAFTNNYPKQIIPAKSNYYGNSSSVQQLRQPVPFLGFPHNIPIQQVSNLPQPASNLNHPFYLTPPQPHYNVSFNGHQANEKYQFDVNQLLPNYNHAINNQAPFSKQLQTAGASDLPKSTLVTDSVSDLLNKGIPQALLTNPANISLSSKEPIPQFLTSQTNDLGPKPIKNGQTFDKKERNVLIPKRRSSKLTENTNSMCAGVSSCYIKCLHNVKLSQ